MSTRIPTPMSFLPVLLTAAALLGCVREPDPPPIPSDLDERSVNLKEVARLVDEIEGMDTKEAAGFLAHADHRVRRAAALHLGALADKAFSETSALVIALEDPHPRVRTAAARALADIGDPSVIPALELKIVDPEPAVRRWVWKALLRFGEPAAAALVPKLAKDAEVGDIHYVDLAGRKQFIRPVLRRHLPLFKATAVPALKKGLDSDDDWLRTNSANVLGQIGEDALDAVPLLITVLKNDPYENARIRAAQALGRIGGDDPDLLPALEDAAKDKAKKVAKEAKRALSSLKKKDKEDKKREAELAKKKAAREKAQKKSKNKVKAGR